MVVEMEKRKWLWKRKPSDKSPGETESSGSLSSYSERYSDEQVKGKKRVYFGPSVNCADME